MKTITCLCCLRRAVAGILALSLAVGALATDLPGFADLALTQDGAYVVDRHSRLAWPRCVEGMHWNGKTCTGQARLMTHGEATAWAAARAKADGVPWRLPRVTELRRWVGKSDTASRQLQEVFPAAPLDWYWTMTASIGTQSVNPYNYGNIVQGRSPGDRLGVQQGWALNMATGDTEGGVSRRSRLLVRLVSSQ
jgi:hypothetical protein